MTVAEARTVQDDEQRATTWDWVFPDDTHLPRAWQVELLTHVKLSPTGPE